MILDIKKYTYAVFSTYYLTINGKQVGSVYFFEKDVKELIANLKRGEDWI